MQLTPRPSFQAKLPHWLFIGTSYSHLKNSFGGRGQSGPTAKAGRLLILKSASVVLCRPFDDDEGIVPLEFVPPCSHYPPLIVHCCLRRFYAVILCSSRSSWPFLLSLFEGKKNETRFKTRTPTPLLWQLDLAHVLCALRFDSFGVHGIVFHTFSSSHSHLF